MHTIAFIGGGNMGRSLIGGLLQDNKTQVTIHVAEPSKTHRQQLEKDFDVSTFADNLEAIKDAEVIVFAVKPHIVQGVCTQLAKADLSQQLIVSIAAGIRSDQIARWLGQKTAIVRVMPNTPALIGLGANGLYATQDVNHAQKSMAELILASCGICQWVRKESDMDIITSLSGSGPAYFFLLVEAMEEAAHNAGLTAESARKLAIQTCIGAGHMMQESDADPATLRQRVTSPNGTTEAALKSFADNDFRAIVNKAMQAARQRAIQLADEND